eukprot:1291643-Rhodomonas_salina.6
MSGTSLPTVLRIPYGVSGTEPNSTELLQYHFSALTELLWYYACICGTSSGLNLCGTRRAKFSALTEPSVRAAFNTPGTVDTAHVCHPAKSNTSIRLCRAIWTRHVVGCTGVCWTLHRMIGGDRIWGIARI